MKRRIYKNLIDFYNVFRLNKGKYTGIFKMKILSFDIGGTKIAYALVDERGKIIGEVKKISTPDTAEKIKTTIQTIINSEKFDGLAFATAGVVFNNKLAKKPLNLPSGYENIDFALLANVPVAVENDANAAAWCEYKIGGAQNSKNAIVLALGTGVGCGIICNGKLLKGKSGAAGECRFAISGKDFAKTALEYGLEPDCFALDDLAKKNNEKAKAVMDKWHKDLFNALGCLNDLFDAEKIVLSGSLSQIVDYTLMQNKIKDFAYGEPPIICKAEDCEFPALIGAALLWFDTYNKGNLI